jgi:Dynein light chain type 1
MSEQRKAVIKNADMDEKMQQDAVDIASKALSEYNIEKVRSMEFFYLSRRSVANPVGRVPHTQSTRLWRQKHICSHTSFVHLPFPLFVSLQI